MNSFNGTFNYKAEFLTDDFLRKLGCTSIRQTKRDFADYGVAKFYDLHYVQHVVRKNSSPA